ncbi:MAG TPA: DegT/DnrJ/EryC1/StrS aminotransferase family protein [Candidatus Binataceae bacterium]|nr:DegT/DnrJ/EryC1/StrS aminotransferase family protein [Candidatus Binataceae bacterium]
MIRQIPFHRPAIGAEEEREVIDTLRSGWITTGPKAKRLEKEFAAYVGARNALAVAHCTGALHLALFALGIGPGDEIITTPFTFTATAEVMGYLGARPVFADIEPDTFNIDPNAIERALASGCHRSVKAIMPVHFAGQACDMDQIGAIARRYQLRIVEDAAHAAGSERMMEGRGMVKIGTIGDLTCFSFYATKNITSAEGGMITTEDDALAAKIAVASLHGMDRDAWKRYDSSGSWFYEIHDTGFKYNLSDVHAAIGVAQLRRAGELMRRRQVIAQAYNEAFRNDPALEIPVIESGVVHAWHLYVLRLRPPALRITRNRFVEVLRERGVGTSVHCIPLNTMAFYQNRYGYRTGDFPVAEDVYSRCLSLPIFPAMSDEDAAYVIESVLTIARENRR